MNEMPPPRLTADELNRRITDKQVNLGRCLRALRDFVLAYESVVEPEAMAAIYDEARNAIEENERVFDLAYIPAPRAALQDADNE